MSKRINAYGFIIFMAVMVIGALAIALVPWNTLDDTGTIIHRQINAYTHLPNGNTKVFYDGGALMEVEGKWYFNQPAKYYEFYRDENSNIWHLDPY